MGLGNITMGCLKIKKVPKTLKMMHQSALYGGMHWLECILTRKNPATWSRFSLFAKLCVLLITWTRNPNWPKRSDGDGKFRTEACGAELGRLLSLRVMDIFSYGSTSRNPSRHQEEVSGTFGVFRVHRGHARYSSRVCRLRTTKD